MQKTCLVILSVLMLVACDKKTKEPIVGTREAVFTDIQTIKIEQHNVKIDLPHPKINAAWPTASGTTHHATAHPALLNHEPREQWRVQLGVGSSSTRRLLNGPIIADEKAFAIDTEGLVSAINLETGALLWQTATVPENEKAQPFGGGVTYENHTLYVATAAAEVLALDTQSGTILWRQKTVAPVRSSPTVQNGYIYVVTINNQLEVIDAKNGMIVWSHTGILETAGLLGGASPAVHEGVVIVPYTSGEIFALRVENGYPLWNESLHTLHALDSVAALSHIKARPVIHHNHVILISHAGRTSALDLRTGKTVWNKDIAGIRSPVVITNYIFMVTTDAQLVCLEQKNGDVLWVKQLPQWLNNVPGKEQILWAGPILTSDGLVLAGSNGQAVFCSPQDGAIQRTLDLNTPILLSPVVAQKTVLFYTENAELIAYR